MMTESDVERYQSANEGGQRRAVDVEQKLRRKKKKDKKSKREKKEAKKLKKLHQATDRSSESDTTARSAREPANISSQAPGANSTKLEKKRKRENSTETNESCESGITSKKEKRKKKEAKKQHSDEGESRGAAESGQNHKKKKAKKHHSGGRQSSTVIDSVSPVANSANNKSSRPTTATECLSDTFPTPAASPSRPSAPSRHSQTHAREQLHFHASPNHDPTPSIAPLVLSTDTRRESERNGKPYSLYSRFKIPTQTPHSSNSRSSNPHSSSSIPISSTLVSSATQELNKKGRFTNAEKDNALSAITEFKAQYNLTDEDIHMIVFKKRPGIAECQIEPKTKKAFWPRLHEALPGRERRNVYNFVRRLLDDRKYAKTGKWTEEDDQQLLSLIAIHGNRWEEIGNHLGRSGNAVMKRHDLLRVKGSNKVLTRERGWSAEEDNQLVEIIKSIIISQGQTITAETLTGFNLFSAAADKLAKQRRAADVRGHWKSVLLKEALKTLEQDNGTNLAPPSEPLFVDHAEQNLKILEVIRSYNANDPTEIPWSNLPTHPSLQAFHLTYSGIYGRYSRLLQHVSDIKNKTFQECIEECKNMLEEKLTRRRKQDEELRNAKPRYLSAEFVDSEDDE